VILAVAGALAVPALQPALEAARIESAARRVAAFLDDVRRAAVLERTALVVECRQHEGRLVLADTTARLRPFPAIAPVELASCSPEELRYLPQGAASGMTVVLRDRGGRSRRVTVGAFTGLARVEVAP
jgi:Tfp pilus assembly protein FimT